MRKAIVLLFYSHCLRIKAISSANFADILGCCLSSISSLQSRYTSEEYYYDFLH